MTFKSPFLPKPSHNSVITEVPLYTVDRFTVVFPTNANLLKIKVFYWTGVAETRNYQSLCN